MNNDISLNDIEQKWQKIWDDNKAFKVEVNQVKPKYYCLEMFPYPSGKIHVGHLRNYSIGDVVSRFMISKGYNVLHPMGWDAFGLPAENAAFSNNTHPAKWTYQNIESMRHQMKKVGISYDWNREFASCDVDYYKYEQKFFLELMEKGLAYQKESIVNWDPIDQTVLANEQVVDGRGWRSGALVEKKKLKQWFLKITNYAEELLDEISNLTGWPESVRLMQEKWIGFSEGANVKFALEGDPGHHISIYTTRPDTLFGASFIAVAYDHPLIQSHITKTKEIQQFIDKCSHKGTSQAEIDKAEKEGVDTGLKVVHPFDPSIKLPIYIANFVLMDYGTGAVFGCPAHDERDFEFATKYDLPIKQVVVPENGEVNLAEGAYTEEGIAINSDFLDGLDTQAAKNKAIEKIIELNCGSRDINYRLKDWGISRQRFWGCPIPIIYCDYCGAVPVPKEDLPVKLPEDITFDKPGNPLDHHPTWKNVNCPKCQAPARRETDTFDTFFESSWYFARFCDKDAPDMTNKEACDYWLPVDQYIGGIEHAVLHLLYARFFTKIMQELGYIGVREPFKNLMTQGMVLHPTFKDSDNQWVYPDEVILENGELKHKISGKSITQGKTEKMSKSKKNVIDLEEMIKIYGADTLRMLALSDSPPEKDLEWSKAGMEGCYKFITRLIQCARIITQDRHNNLNDGKGDEVSSDSAKLLTKAHHTIKYVTDDIEHFRLNKAIARIRELYNDLSDKLNQPQSERNYKILTFSLESVIRLLNPFIPHVTEEIWSILGHDEALYKMPWPEYEEKYLLASHVTIAIQVNGKLRATLDFNSDASVDDIKKAATEDFAVQKHIDGKEIKKVIYVPGKIVNIVAI